jgi:hypothetical protein
MEGRMAVNNEPLLPWFGCSQLLVAGAGPLHLNFLDLMQPLMWLGDSSSFSRRVSLSGGQVENGVLDVGI